MINRRKPLKRTPLKRSQKPIPKKRVKPKREKPVELPEFPKPRDIKNEPVAVRVMKDGREVCNLLTKAGRDEYERRKRFAWETAGRICPLCKLPLAWKDSTVDHIKLRKMGGGSRDDRQENIAAVHGLCNAKRGSRTHGFYGVD